MVYGRIYYCPHCKNKLFIPSKGSILQSIVAACQSLCTSCLEPEIAADGQASSCCPYQRCQQAREAGCAAFKSISEHVHRSPDLKKDCYVPSTCQYSRPGECDARCPCRLGADRPQGSCPRFKGAEAERDCREDSVKEADGASQCYAGRPCYGSEPVARSVKAQRSPAPQSYRSEESDEYYNASAAFRSDDCGASADASQRKGSSPASPRASCRVGEVRKCRCDSSAGCCCRVVEDLEGVVSDGHKVTSAQERDEFTRKIGHLMRKTPLHIHNVILPEGVSPDDPRLKTARVVKRRVYYTRNYEIPQGEFVYSMAPGLQQVLDE